MKRTFEAKRRQQTGNASFSEEVVRKIRKLHEGGHSPREIAEVYLVGIETIRKLLRGETYGWVTEAERAEGIAEGIMGIPDEVVDKEGLEILERLKQKGLIRGVEGSAAARMNREVKEVRDREEELDKFIKPDGE